MPTIKHFTFGAGFHQETDERMLEPGTPRAVENLVKLKNGRMGMRKDYDNLVMSAYNGTLVATDIVNFDGRLCAFGDTQSRAYPSDVFEYLGTGAAAAWSGTEGTDTDMRIGQATNLRDMGRLPSTGLDCNCVDVAAASGFVCVVSSYVTPGTATTVQSTVHVFRASTGQTILVESSTTILFRPRVVAIANVFYIMGLTAAGTSITLRQFNPASHTQTFAVSTPFGVAAAIVAWDMTVDGAGTEIVAAVARTGPTTQIQRITTAGASAQTIAGPATLMDFVTVSNDGTRIHFCDVPNATKIIRLSTYLVAGGALENGPTTVFGALTTIQQPSLSVHSATVIRVVAQTDSTSFPAASFDTRSSDRTVSTHVDAGGPAWGTVKLTTKLLPRATGSTVTHFFGGQFLDPDDTAILGAIDTYQPMAAKEHNTAASVSQLPHMARDSSTGLVYWPQMIEDEDAFGVPVVTEYALLTSERFQTATLGGHLYMARGQLLVSDTKQVVESGFLDVPVILGAPGATTGPGLLTLLATYQVRVTFEAEDAFGHLHQSPPSEVTTVTLTGTQNTINVTCTQPHSIRNNETNEKFLNGVKRVVWCTTAGGTVFFRAAVGRVIIQDLFFFGSAIPVIGPDTTLDDQETLYIQAERGDISGPLPFETALPCRYIWASKDKLRIGGLPYGPQAQESRPLFPNEPIQWSLELGYFTIIRGDMTATAIMDETRFDFSNREIFAVPGEGIDDLGGGTLGPPVKLPSDGGCIDWRSLVECSLGLFFQLDTDKIYLIPRGGGAPVWIGLPVQDKLAEFPVITSATLISKDQTVRFTCNNTGNTDGILLIYDIRHGEWMTEGPFSAAIQASCEYQGRMCLVRAGVVSQQRLTHPPAAFINNAWRSGTEYPFGRGNQGRVYAFVWYGEFVGNFTLTCVVTWFDATTAGFTTETLAAKTFSGFSAGQLISHRFTANQSKCEAYRVDFQQTSLAGAATGGGIYHFWGIEQDPANKAAHKAPLQMS